MAVSGEKLYLYMMTMTAESQFFLIEGSKCHKLNPQPWNRYFSWKSKVTRCKNISELIQKLDNDRNDDYNKKVE